MPKQVTLDGKSVPPPPRLHRDPNDPFFIALRQIAYKCLLDWWKKYHAGILRDVLISLVYEEIKAREFRGEWKYPIPKKETVRKRVNELLEEHVVGSPPKAFAVPIKLENCLTTIYFPHPELMPERDREEIYALIEEWKKQR